MNMEHISHTEVMDESYNQEMQNSNTIRNEILRFESVHPSIYAIYDLIQSVSNPDLQVQIRDHLINVEDAFVSSQEWTLSRSIPEIRLGVIGTLSSGKSALVHRYLTGSYVQDEAPEGGRFKKEITSFNQNCLLLVRDEGGQPSMQFSGWLDALVIVFSLADESSFQTAYEYQHEIANMRDLNNVPVVLVGTQDSITGAKPRVISDDRARKFAASIKRCTYYETCATYGLNVDRVFSDVCHKVVLSRRRGESILTSHMSASQSSLSNPSTPMHRSFSTSGYLDNSFMLNPYMMREISGSETSNNLMIQTPPRQKARRKSSIFSGRKRYDSDEKKKNKELEVRDVGFGRNIPLKQGWLYKRTSNSKLREWKKRYVVLCDDGRLSYYSSMHDYMENTHGKSMHVVKTTVKIPGRYTNKSTPNKENKNNFDVEFHLVSLEGAVWQFSCPNEHERELWVTLIEQQIMASLQNGSSNKTNSDISISVPLNINVIRPLPGNQECVDCCASAPMWTSLNLGCLMCIQCSGIHRNLGSHLSRVRSIELDEWPVEYTCVMKSVGNQMCNAVYEGKPLSKPSPLVTREERESFIRDKYENKRFVLDLPQGHEVGSYLCESVANSNMIGFLHALALASSCDVNATVGRHHKSALHIAAGIGDLAMVQLLLWYKADAMQCDANGATAVSIAEQNGHRECYRVLSMSVPKPPSNPNVDRGSLNSSASSSLSIATLPSAELQSNTDSSFNGKIEIIRPNVNYMYTTAI